MRKLFSVLVLCCFLLCGSCSSAELQKYEYTSGPFHYSVRSDWYYDSSEENNIHSNTHMRDKNDPFTGLIMVDTVSSPLVSAADSISSVLDPFSIFSALDPFPELSFRDDEQFALPGQPYTPIPPHSRLATSFRGRG